MLLLSLSPYSPLQLTAGPGPQFPPSPQAPEGKATILKQHNLLELRLRLDPGLLAPDEHAFIANVSLVRTDGFRIPPTAASWTPEQLTAIRRASAEGTGNFETAAMLPFQIPSVPKGEVLAGEAVLRVFRLEPLPVTLAPGETERHYRRHGRNHWLKVETGIDGLSGTWQRPGFSAQWTELWRQWSVDTRLLLPAAIRVSRPGEAPHWLCPDLIKPDGASGRRLLQLHFTAHSPAPALDVTQSTCEFFEDRPVRVLRVSLVPEQ